MKINVMSTKKNDGHELDWHHKRRYVRRAVLRAEVNLLWRALPSNVDHDASQAIVCQQYQICRGRCVQQEGHHQHCPIPAAGRGQTSHGHAQEGRQQNDIGEEGQNTTMLPNQRMQDNSKNKMRKLIRNRSK